MTDTSEMTIRPIPPFDFELSATIFSNGDIQIRKYDNRIFWQVIRVDGKLFLTTITSSGTVNEPKLKVRLESNEKILPTYRERAKQIICTIFNLSSNLSPFYEHVKEDSVMAHLTRELKGLKSPTTPTVFEALIDSIVEQQISLNIANKMEERLIKEFGEMLNLDKAYYAFPTPNELASASLHKLRSCGLSQRKTEYIKDISKMVAERRLNLEKFRNYGEANDIVTELDKIKGIGIWTAELTIVRGMQRLDVLPADDLGLRRVISHYYCNDRQISGQEARKISEKWGTWKGLAGFYLIIANMKHVKN